MKEFRWARLWGIDSDEPLQEGEKVLMVRQDGASDRHEITYVEQYITTKGKVRYRGLVGEEC